jgi:hypothetical protein
MRPPEPGLEGQHCKTVVIEGRHHTVRVIIPYLGDLTYSVIICGSEAFP